MLGGYGTRTFFAMQALDMHDVRSGQGQEIEGFLIVMTYICSRCNHIDLYSSRQKAED